MAHLFIVSLIIWATLSKADICSYLPGYKVHGTSCFKLYSVPKTWAAAEASCVADGGHLASIHSSEEQAFVASLGAAGPWIGLSGTPPIMNWSDGTDVDYENWYGSNPNDQETSCTIIVSSYQYSWHDIQCSGLAKHTCRIEPAVDETEARFLMVPGGMPTDPAVSPSSIQIVRSRLQCARRCQQDGGCVHFIMREDGGRYLCETYTTLYRAPTLAAQPTYNYQKIYP